MASVGKLIKQGEEIFYCGCGKVVVYVLSEHTLSGEPVLNLLFPKEMIDVRPKELHKNE